MVLLEKLWDDVIAGPQPERGLGKLRKVTTMPPSLNTKGVGAPGPASPTTPSPSTPSPTGRKENVWRSVFHPGSNIATKGIGAEKFDKPQPNSPTVYDWLYSEETRSKHR